MKNLSLILNAILLVAVIILFILVLGNKKCGTETTITKKGDYTFAKNANEALTKKQEDSRLTINSRERELQGEMVNFQKKLENNAFLSRERAEQEQIRLQKKQQDLQEMAGRLSEQIMTQQQKVSEQLRDTINSFLKTYNKDGKYQIILSNTSNDNVLYAGKQYDITNDVVKKLNDRFKSK